jgi:hypothetical protein
MVPLFQLLFNFYKTVLVDVLYSIFWFLSLMGVTGAEDNVVLLDGAFLINTICYFQKLFLWLFYFG